MTLKERIAIAISAEQIDEKMAGILRIMNEEIASNTLDWIQFRRGQKLVKEWSTMGVTDRDNNDYLRGFYDGCKHTKRINYGNGNHD